MKSIVWYIEETQETNEKLKQNGQQAAAAATKLKKRNNKQNKSETEREIFETENSRVSIHCCTMIFCTMLKEKVCVSRFSYFTVQHMVQ